MSKVRVPVLWTDTAWADIEEMLLWQEAQGTDSAILESYVQRILKGAKYLASFPNMGRCGVLGGTREWLVTKTPYFLVYAECDNGIAILRVMHGKRNYPD